LNGADEDAFVRRLLEGLGTYPAYFGRLAEINRRGPDVIAMMPDLPSLDVPAVRRLATDGALVVDVRPLADYAAGHVPGSVSIPLRDQFATWLGWLLEPGTPAVVVRNAGQDPAEIVWPALTVGFDSLVGELAGGMEAWRAAGGDVRTTELVEPKDTEPRGVIDVRQASEHATGHLPGAHLVELGSIADVAPDLPAGPVATMCGHGERAATAASLLERAGRDDITILAGGPADWSAATGRPLEIRA
jgi:rhodanese-related sulfurtransferase